jgi:flagellar hook-basal body complex protein FliE
MLLAAGGLSVSLLVACGGGSGADPLPAATVDSVSLTETATDFTVAAQHDRGSHIWSAMQFGFTANVTAGTHAGSTISGALLLKGESDEDGGTVLEGRLLVGTLPAAIGGAGGMPARSLIADFRTRADALRITLRSQIEILHLQLKADLDAAADDAARQAAKQAFGVAFKALIDAFQQAMTQALGAVSQQQRQAESLQRELQLDNPAVSLEQTMVAMQKAQIGFQAVLSVRSRLVQAYSEIMNMQV